MNGLVKILTSDSGEPREKANQVWHYVDVACAGNQTLCEGEYFGLGESGCKYKTKTVEKGGITCKECINKIKDYKAIKL